MVRKLLSQIIAAGVGLWLATLIVPGVQLTLLADSSFFGFPITQTWQLFLLLGIILGLLNFFARPVLNAITLPIRILTLGLSSFVINGLLIWVLTLMFRELTVPLWLPLIYTTLIVWAIHFLLSILLFSGKEG